MATTKEEAKAPVGGVASTTKDASKGEIISNTPSQAAANAQRSGDEFTVMRDQAIGRVSVITKTRSGSPIVVIGRLGNKYGIIRSAKQILTDLKNSFMIDLDITDINHPQVREALAELQDGDRTLTGSIAEYNKGTTYVIDEFSNEYINDKSTLGQERERTADSAIIERGTFLEFKRTSESKQIRANGRGYADAMVRLFKVPVSPTVAAQQQPATTDATPVKAPGVADPLVNQE